MNITDKDVAASYKVLGQYMTPGEVVDFCLSKIQFDCDIVVEPSCGRGAFLDKIRRVVGDKTQVIAIEFDTSLAAEYTGSEQIEIGNFYDFNEGFDRPVHFVGNPPYRSPAHSLTTHEHYVKGLRDKYGVRGMREESVLFFLKTYDLLRECGGRISYILPSAIFKNNSKAFTAFSNFLRQNLKLVSVWNIGDKFEGVGRDLVFADFEIGRSGSTFMLNGQQHKIDEFYGVSSNIIPFQKMFRKTYLGSVPCEGIFMSVRGEPLGHFMERLVGLFSEDISEDNLVSMLSYNGLPHLRALQKGDAKKIQVMLNYIRQAKGLAGFDLSLFENEYNYRSIRHREEDRFYFRHDFLKKAPFVYQLNPKPCASFYFPGNPSSSSADYFGFCPYDVNRNSGPGANRTVPLDGIEDNLTDEFKYYWDQNTKRPYSDVFDYILHISRSSWYRNFKSQNQRFYFGVPRQFDQEWTKLTTSS